MLNIITPILNNPKVFNRLTIAMIALPTGFVILFPEYLKAMFEFGLILLIVQNAHLVYNKIKYKSDAPIGVKLYSYSLIFFYTYGIYVIFLIADAIFGFDLTPITIAFLFFIIYGIWLVKIYDFLKFSTEQVILKGETNVKARIQMTFDEFYLPVGIVLIYFLLRFTFVSFTSTKGQQVITSSAYPLIIIPILIVIHLFIHAYIIDQFNWQSSTGYTTWKEFRFILPLPEIADPQELSHYFKMAARMLNPPDKIFDHLYDNMKTLFRNCETLEYLPFVSNFINAMGNWGRQIRDHVHLLHFVVIAQISKYRILGLIPSYQRNMFYNYLAVLSKAGIFGPDWYELIDYEAVSQKDESHTIDWVAGIHWKDYLHQDGWETTWENVIYKGKQGYYEARKKLETVFFVKTIDDEWTNDVWETTLEYIQLFIGIESRKVFSENLGIYNKLLYLSTGQLLKNYEEVVLESQMLIKEQHVKKMQREINKTIVYKSDSLTKEEKMKRMEDAFETKELTYSSSYKQEFLNIFHNIGSSIKNINLKSILLLSKFIALIILNLLLFQVLIQIWSFNIALYAFAIEFILLAFYSIEPPSSGSRTIGTTAALQMRSVGEQTTIDLQAQTKPVLFAVILAIGFGIIFL